MLLMAKPKADSQPTPFGARLKALRKAAGMSQPKLAELIGATRQAVARLENSPEANPTIETVRKLAVALNCTPNDLIPLDDPPESK